MVGNSYQKNGPVPHRIDQIGQSPVEWARKRRFRRRLFVGSSAAVICILVVMMFVVMERQIERHKLMQAPVNLVNLNSMTDDSVVPSGCETTVILSRHCEKDGAEVQDEHGDEHCSYLGFERAHFFATLFGEDGWPVPSFLYALSAERGGHLNFREIETITPLAKKFDLEMNTDYATNVELAAEVFELISSGAMCGKTALVSWKHELLGPLAGHLACEECPRTYPNQFDEVWLLKYVYDVEGTPIYKRATLSEEEMLRDMSKTWSVYFTAMNQDFDPLKFSNLMGDYDEGNEVGGKWYSNTGDDEM